jgi:uncharacterized damage-inducible protein DinB
VNAASTAAPHLVFIETPALILLIVYREEFAPMKLTELFLSELAREVDRSRRALQEVPAGKYDWKPHEKSMQFGYLADMVASIPSWIAMEVKENELDVAPAQPRMKPTPKETSAALIEALDKSAADARAALEGTTDDHLKTPWRLLARGQVVQEAPRYEMIRDTINHWAHHRGQMTVYLRLMGAKVPAIYGPSADDKAFR